MREEVKLDASSPEDGVPAIELVDATVEAKPLVERDGVVQGAARQYWNCEIVRLQRHDRGHYSVGVWYWGLRRLTHQIRSGQS